MFKINYNMGNLRRTKQIYITGGIMCLFVLIADVSSNINVVTVSSINNNVVGGYIQKSFSNIPKKIVPKVTLEKPFFENKGKNYFLKSVSKEHTLVYLWEIPAHITNYLTSHSPHVISHVISSDNNSSLKQMLIKKGLKLPT